MLEKPIILSDAELKACRDEIHTRRKALMDYILSLPEKTGLNHTEFTLALHTDTLTKRLQSLINRQAKSNNKAKYSTRIAAYTHVLEQHNLIVDMEKDLSFYITESQAARTPSKERISAQSKTATGQPTRPPKTQIPPR